jgi:hypothetical protein
VAVESLGSRIWLIPDGYLPTGELGAFESHEAVCVLNTGTVAARVQITLYLEDEEPLGPIVVEVPGQRTRHIRTDRLPAVDGRRLRREVPYALRIESDLPIGVQHSRLDVSSGSMALMTTAGIAIDR